MYIFSAFQHSEWTMKKKLFGYMFCLVLLLILALTSGLFLLGRFDSIGKNTYEVLDIQMKVFERDIDTHFDRLTAANIQLSHDTSTLLDGYLGARESAFHDLNDNPSAIEEIQDALIESLLQKLQQENCSGIFVMLDVTADSTAQNSEQSRSGLYLQRNRYKNTESSVLLYRGLSETGKHRNILPHRKWSPEFRTASFPDYDKLLSCAVLSPAKASLLTDRFTLPGTAEDVFLLTSPIVGSDGTFYGICGYEVSTGYFMAYHSQPTIISHLTCLLTPGNGEVLHPETGLGCGVMNSYYEPPKEELQIQKFDHGLLLFSGNDASYLGLSHEIQLTPNNPPHTLTVMMPKADYDKAMTKNILQNLILWSLLLFFTISCCLYFSRRFLSPILKGLEQIKSEKYQEASSTLPEINDLFIFLAEQDQKYEQTQSDYLKTREELTAAQTELDRLAYSRKTEIDPADYENFLIGIKTLTKTERQIFEWYLEGKTAEEILELSGTQKGTLKFHNHNILSKLGVPSRKQMLRFAALMKQQEKESANLN